MHVIYWKWKTWKWLKLLLDKLNIENVVMDDQDLDEKILDNAEKIIHSPWIPQSNIIYVKHKEKVYSELNFVWSILDKLWMRRNIEFIGITWTNGKSSSVRILYNIFKALNLKSNIWLTWNFDTPLSQTLFEILDRFEHQKNKWNDIFLDERTIPTTWENNTKIDRYKKLENEKHIMVTECSSFMLWGLKDIKFDYSVWLNFSIDHLNRHKDLQEYFDTKKILLQQTKKVWFVDRELFEKLSKEGLSCKIEVYDENYDISGSKFIGKHNAGNINACYMLVKEYLQDTTDWSQQEIIEKLKKIIDQIEPLPHHTTLVKNVNWIKIYDDAKCTSSLALWAALRCFDEKIVLICGWFDKWGDDFQELKPEFEKVVAYCPLIGQTAHYFVDICEEKKIGYKEHNSLQKAVNDALGFARKNNIKVILFSPWCASFGMFKNFEERAKMFMEIVDELQ